MIIRPALPFSVVEMIIEEDDPETKDVYHVLDTEEGVIVGVSEQHPSLYWVGQDSEEALDGIRALVANYRDSSSSF
jgi:hypothetical protein